MEINESSVAVFYVSRIFGYAPYLIERTVSGKIKRISSNNLLRAYSFTLLTILGLCIMGLYNDVEAKVSLRMRSTTAKVATVFDVNIVAASCLFGVISSTAGFSQMQEVNRRLKEADDILVIYIGRDDQLKRRTFKLLVPIFTAILSILALDVYGWYKQALKITRAHAIDYPQANAVNNLYWYLPFYILYVFLMTLQIQFTHISWNLGTRYRRLNIALSTTFNREKSSSQQKTAGFNTVPEFGKHEKVVNFTPRRDRAAHLHNIYLKNFAYVHESLGKSVISISSYFGITLLLLLSSCLLHLTVTAYFLILSLLDENDIDPFHISLQCLWLGFHSFRLLLIVEPCNITTVESSHTTHLVCNILRDRPSSIVVLWSITTYLVILLQFEKIYG